MRSLKQLVWLRTLAGLSPRKVMPLQESVTHTSVARQSVLVFPLYSTYRMQVQRGAMWRCTGSRIGLLASGHRSALGMAMGAGHRAACASALTQRQASGEPATWPAASRVQQACSVLGNSSTRPQRWTGRCLATAVDTPKQLVSKPDNGESFAAEGARSSMHCR